MQSRRPAGLVTRSKSLLIRIPASDPARSESFDIFLRGRGEFVSNYLKDKKQFVFRVTLRVPTVFKYGLLKRLYLFRVKV